MKFLVDENVGQSIVEYLLNKKHDVLTAKEELTGRDDAVLMERAFKEERIIITNDKDFGYLYFKSKLNAYGIILLRLKDEDPTLKISTLHTILELHHDKVINHFIVADENKIRIRPLNK
jgi:predicted nuclease of predicted toxin-antitoxin system